MGFLVSYDGTVGLDEDIFGDAVVDDFFLLEPGVELGGSLVVMFWERCCDVCMEDIRDGEARLPQSD